MNKLKLSVAIISLIMISFLYGRFVQTNVWTTECVKCENGVSYFQVYNSQITKEYNGTCKIGATYKVYLFDYEDMNDSNDEIIKVVEVK